MEKKIFFDKKNKTVHFASKIGVSQEKMDQNVQYMRKMRWKGAKLGLIAMPIFIILFIFIAPKFCGSSGDIDITMQQYQQLNTQMTYDQVVDVIGDAQFDLGEMTIAAKKTHTYKWGNHLAYVTIVFQDGQLLHKSQYGVK